MTKSEFNEMLNAVMKAGVRLTMFVKENDTRIWYDLNTGMKSHFHVMYDVENSVAIGEGRYDTTTIEDFEDLLHEVWHCKYGCEFMSDNWNKIFRGME